MWGTCQYRSPGSSIGACNEAAELQQWDHRWGREFPMCGPHALGMQGANRAARSYRLESIRNWVVGLVIGGVILFAWIQNNLQSTPSHPSYQGVTYGGYENPAPGNDGSFDCVPGQAPIYVGSNDPAGLDGDGDGVGCET